VPSRRELRRERAARADPTRGFDQSFRSVISESLVGSVEAPEYQIAGGALDLRPWTNAWLSLQVQALESTLERNFGIFAFNSFGSPPASPATAVQQLDYHELQARAALNQILGREWFSRHNTNSRTQSWRAHCRRFRPPRLCALNHFLRRSPRTPVGSDVAVAHRLFRAKRTLVVWARSRRGQAAACG